MAGSPTVRLLGDLMVEFQFATTNQFVGLHVYRDTTFWWVSTHTAFDTIVMDNSHDAGTGRSDDDVRYFEMVSATMVFKRR
jgi:hypothetical protein